MPGCQIWKIKRRLREIINQEGETFSIISSLKFSMDMSWHQTFQRKICGQELRSRLAWAAWRPSQEKGQAMSRKISRQGCCQGASLSGIGAKMHRWLPWATWLNSHQTCVSSFSRLRKVCTRAKIKRWSASFSFLSAQWSIISSIRGLSTLILSMVKAKCKEKYWLVSIWSNVPNSRMMQKMSLNATSSWSKC